MENKNYEIAYLAGGCFWCIEGIMDAQPGVIEAISGYAGGDKDSAKYDEVSKGITDHREAVKVIYDPIKITYKELLEIFFMQIDPTDPGGQFADRGFHYTSAVYYTDENQEKIAGKVIENLDTSGEFDKPVVTALEEFSTFFEAEDYHQNYASKNSFRYNIYKKGSGRADFIDDNEGKYNKIFNPEKMSKEELKEKLTPLQYEVTQNEGTEMPFDNEYWDHKETGIYVDITDGTPLFSSLDKYDSGSGWPAFTRPIDEALLEEKEDNKLLQTRMEVRSKSGDSHLGHVFTDGPEEEGGLRYCINSAALRFVGVEDLEKEGYSEYLKLFK